MKTSRSFSILLASCISLILGFKAMHPPFVIPKTWDITEIRKFLLPLANANVTVTPISEAYYYTLPQMNVYKSYPIKILDPQTNRKYIDSLRRLDPVDYFALPPQTEQDLVRLGEYVFSAPLITFPYSEEFYTNLVEDIKHAEIPVANNLFPYMTYVVDKSSEVKIGVFSCAMCHTRVTENGLIIKGAQGTFPMDKRDGISIEKQWIGLDEAKQAKFLENYRNARKSLQRAPWIEHPSQTELDSIPIEKIIAYLKAVPSGVMIRHGTNFNQPTNIPDLIGIKDRKYLDNTGLMRHRNIGDLMRYAAFNQTLDLLNSYNGFIPAGTDFKQLPEPRKAKVVGTSSRYSELQLFALSHYLYALKPPVNPNSFPAELLRKGEVVFKREGCVSCHTPPLYTNNQLTPVDGFTPPKEHFTNYDIFDISVETDPQLALYTRRGTGYYKIPSLLGLCYRGPYGHSGHVATLEEWLDSKRLQEDYVPSGFKPAFVKTMAVKGHEFGLDLPKEEKEALLAFLRSL